MGLGLGLGLGVRLRRASLRSSQVKPSPHGSLARPAWLQHSQTGAEPRCARRDLVAGPGLGQLGRAGTVRERQALRVESTPTSYRSSRPSRPRARPSARPLSRVSGLQCRSAPCRPLAPATRTVPRGKSGRPQRAIRFDAISLAGRRALREQRSGWHAVSSAALVAFAITEVNPFPLSLRRVRRFPLSLR